VPSAGVVMFSGAGRREGFFFIGNYAKAVIGRTRRSASASRAVLGNRVEATGWSGPRDEPDLIVEDCYFAVRFMRRRFLR
jgi:hypothetical protein